MPATHMADVPLSATNKACFPSPLEIGSTIIYDLLLYFRIDSVILSLKWDEDSWVYLAIIDRMWLLATITHAVGK
jgi:hypothetical protein